MTSIVACDFSVNLGSTAVDPGSMAVLAPPPGPHPSRAYLSSSWLPQKKLPLSVETPE